MRPSTAVMFITSLVILALSPAVVPLASLPGPCSSAPVPGTAVAQTPACTGERLDLRIELDEIFEAQRRDGSIEFQGGDSLLYYHPILASLSLDVYKQTGDTAFLERARRAVSAYFNYLLVHHDTDGDFLIERTTYRHLSGGGTPGIEGVGFNSLLALDMLSLSEICLALEDPVDALYWYQGMKTYFHRDLGDNISRSVLRNYLLTDHPSPHECPAHYVEWNFDDKDLRRTTRDERLLRAILLLGALEANGFDDEAAAYRNRIREATGTTGATDGDRAADGVWARFLRCALGSASPCSPFPRNPDLDLLEILAFQKALLAAPEIARLRSAMSVVREFVATGGSLPGPARPKNGGGPTGADDGSRGGVRSQTDPLDPSHLGTVEQSIRDVYFSISALREKWKARTLYPSRMRDKLPGFDMYGATAVLWDDVIETLHDAENLVVRSQTRDTGFEVTATLLGEATAPGVPVRLKCGFSAMVRALDLESVVIFRDQTVDTLLGADRGVRLEPGTPPYELPYAFPVHAAGTKTIRPLRFSMEVVLGHHERHRFYFRRGVYLTDPLTFSVAFPHGNVLSGGSVPIRIQVDKHTPEGAVIHAQWYSPAGLRPMEGRAVEAWMPENLQQTSMDMNILVPTPCRPGAFPFVLKVFANGVDVGTVESSFFKHYQWLFVGPFAAKRSALDSPYPPEGHVNLLATYDGVGTQISWRPLPAAAYADHGNLSLGALLPKGSVGFLATVIHCGSERTVTTVFRSRTPAVLYINGDEIIRVRGGTNPSDTRAGVVLNEGMNNVLIKILSHGVPDVYFQLGDEQDLTTDEFNNNLWELVDGYRDLQERDGGLPVEQAGTQRRVTLTYHNPEANSVAVVGNFNGWSPANSSMRRNKYGDWEINLYLAPGRYAYRFLVNNSDQILDPKSNIDEPDGYGSRNSVLFVE
ncbi:MAG: isoamylase early set domain-containing protein [bacterium]